MYLEVHDIIRANLERQKMTKFRYEIDERALMKMAFSMGTPIYGLDGIAVEWATGVEYSCFGREAIFHAMLWRHDNRKVRPYMQSQISRE